MLYNHMDHLGQQFEACRCLDHRAAHRKVEVPLPILSRRQNLTPLLCWDYITLPKRLHRWERPTAAFRALEKVLGSAKRAAPLSISFSSLQIQQA